MGEEAEVEIGSSKLKVADVANSQHGQRHPIAEQQTSIIRLQMKQGHLLLISVHWTSTFLACFFLSANLLVLNLRRDDARKSHWQMENDTGESITGASN